MTACEPLSITTGVPRAAGSPEKIVEAAVLNFIGGTTLFIREAPHRSWASGWLVITGNRTNLLPKWLNQQFGDFLLTLGVTRGGRTPDAR